MATIGQLLDRLEIQIHDLTWTPQDTVGAHAAGWMLLARVTGQAITLLPLGGRSDQVKAGIRNVLAPLAGGPRKSDDDAVPAPQLVELATTVGAISDSLVGILRWGPRPEHVGTPALELEAELLSAVHVAARWSRAAVETQCPTPPRPQLVTFLSDLVVVTEPYALIPPQRRASTLEDLAFTAPSSPGPEGVTAAWAETAGSVLGDRFRVGGWAMQVIAADLALISRAARRPFVRAEAGVQGEKSLAAHVSAALTQAARSWRQAAAWPPHLRLGGQNTELRQSSGDLREYLVPERDFSAAEARRILGLAAPIAAAHARRMNDLVRMHALWIHAPLLVPRVPCQTGWIREPEWSSEGRPVLLAAQTAHHALDRALEAAGVDNAPEQVRTKRPRWAPLPESAAGHSCELMVPSGSRELERGVSR